MMVYQHGYGLLILFAFTMVISPRMFSQVDYEVNKIFGMKKRYNRSADGTVEVFQYTNTDVNSSWASTELVIVKIKVAAKIEIHDFRTSSTVNKLISAVTFQDQPLVIMSGGFFQKDDQKRKSPIGLVVDDYKVISKFYPWDEGGIILQQPGEDFLIVPVGMYEVMDFGRVVHALQTLPLVIEEGKIAIHNKSFSKGHRIGIGYDVDGNIIVACGFAPHSASFSLYDFAHLLDYPKNKGGPELESFIALDGGPSIFLKIPSLNLEFGRKSNEVDYIVNLLSIQKR